MKRKSISKKTRFEVFKRDLFTCQYCGKKAPDVLLEIDHIKPVAKGGNNGILNLLTACQGCNSGKSDRELSDQSVIEKQRKQLADLEERRQQLEMMMQWHTGLQDHANHEIDKFLEYFNKTVGCNISLSDSGKVSAKKHIKKFGFQKVLEAVDVVASKYSYLTEEEKFKKLGGVLTYLTSSEDEKQALYIKGVCRNRLSYFDFSRGTQLIKDVLKEYKYDYVLEIAKTARNWTSWKSQMENLLAYANDEEDETEGFEF